MYRVVLPVEIDGVVYNFGQVVELDLERAALYAHALITVEGENGGDSEGH
jgi:hypothetical protein